MKENLEDSDSENDYFRRAIGVPKDETKELGSAYLY